MALVQRTGSEWLGEASRLRAVELPPEAAGPHAWDAALKEVRGRLDRLEAIRVNALSLRATIRAGSRQYTAAYEDAWGEAARTEATTGRGARDFEGAKERGVRLDLAVIGQKRDARQWEIAKEMADTIAEQLRLMHAGLDGTRSDIHDHLRFLTWEHSLERT